jgi:hypothetical protein
MAKAKFESIRLGLGDLINTTDSEVFAETSAPTPSDGKDGDLWLRLAGANSAVYHKRNGQWYRFTEGFLDSVNLANNASNAPLFSYDRILFPSARIQYFVTSVAGDVEQGEMGIVADATDAVGAVSDVVSIGSDMNLDFDFAVSGSNVNVTYSSGPTPTNRVLFYRIKE